MDKNSVDKLLKSFIENNSSKLNSLNKENAALGDAMSTLFQAISKKYGQGEINKNMVIPIINKKYTTRLTRDMLNNLALGTKIALPKTKQGREDSQIATSVNDIINAPSRGIKEPIKYYYYNGFEDGDKNNDVLLWYLNEKNNGNYYNPDKDELYLYQEEEVINEKEQPKILSPSTNTNKWRLPTKEEFENILWPNKDLIPNLKIDDYYWSSTEYGNNAAWDFMFRDDRVSEEDKRLALQVRPVRDILPNSANSANSTIVGNLKVWNEDLGEMTWNDAMKAVNELNNTQTAQSSTSKPLSYAELKALGLGTKIRIPEGTGTPTIGSDGNRVATDKYIELTKEFIAKKLNIKPEEVEWVEIVGFDDLVNSIKVNRMDEEGVGIDYFFIWPDNVDVYLYEENKTSQPTSTNKKYKPFDVKKLPSDFSIKINQDVELAYNVVDNLYSQGISWSTDRSAIYTQEKRRKAIEDAAGIEWLDIADKSTFTYDNTKINDSPNLYEFNANGDLIPYNSTNSTTNSLPVVTKKLSNWTPDFKAKGYRPSPQRSAAQSTLMEFGAGFDNTIYRVEQDKRGVQKWKKQPYYAYMRPDLLTKKEDLFVIYDMAKNANVNTNMLNNILKRIVELNIQLP